MHTATATSRQPIGGAESHFIRTGFEIHYAGLTRSDDASNGLSTQLFLVGAGETEGEQR